MDCDVLWSSANSLKTHKRIHMYIYIYLHSCILIAIIRIVTMNLVGSMWSQDNINKVVSQEREKCNSLPVDTMIDKKKKQKHVGSNNQP